METGLRLPRALRDRGDRLLHLPVVDSTMDEARRLGAHPSARLWIVADSQDSGRGRGDRRWRSPPGNLHLTVLAPTAAPLRDQPKLGFVVGVALAEAAAALLPGSVDVRLKWPNDLLLDGGKASGVLLEGSDGGSAIAIGIGVNVAAHPEDLPYRAAHLSAWDRSIDRDRVFARLAVALASALDAFEAEGFEPVRRRWLRSAAHLGERISVRGFGAPLEGRFADLDASGRLVLETDAGTTTISAGDVFPLDKPDADGQELATTTSQSRA